MSDLSERVLCFPSSRLDSIGRFQGYCSDKTIISTIFNSDITQFKFLPRSEVESDSSWKQIVTYSLIQYGLYEYDTLIFSYSRGKSGGEDRLKTLKSIGIGGHISEAVKDRKIVGNSSFNQKEHLHLEYARSEALREIDEEIKYESRRPLLSLIGALNDDSNDVGKVHLGLVFRLLVSNPNVSAKEDCIADGEMITFNQLRRSEPEYENWSRILIKSMKFHGY